MHDRDASKSRVDSRRRFVDAGCTRRSRQARRDPGAAAVASYLADMTAQLETMATAAGFGLLGYLLALAHAESEAAARGAETKGDDAAA